VALYLASERHADRSGVPHVDLHPLIVAVTFLLGFVVERTDSLLLAVTLHEWLDIAVDSGGTYLMWAALACIPLWLWLIWTWPDRTSAHMPTSTTEAREIKQIVVTRE
jgi:hypothetical protein